MGYMFLAGGSTFIDPSVVLYPLSIGTGANVSNEGNWSSVINKNLSIRFRSKFRKQSEGSISNYLRAIPFARTCFQLSNGNTRMIAWVIAKTVQGEGLIYSEEFFILTTLIIRVIRKCGLCDNSDRSCWGAGLWWSVRQKLSVVTSDGIPPSQLWAGSAQLVIEWIN